MNKLNEADLSTSTKEVGNHDRTEDKGLDNEERKESFISDPGTKITEEKNTKQETDEKDVLKFTMLFNKYSSVMDVKRRNDEDKRDSKYSMFFNKGTTEVTIRRVPDTPSPAAKLLEAKKSGFFNLRRNQPIRANKMKSKVNLQNVSSNLEPHIREPGVMFCNSLFYSLPDLFESKPQSKPENLKKFLNKRNSRVDDSLVQLNVYPATQQRDLRNHNSLTNLQKNSKLSLKSKIPSLTALDGNFVHPRSGYSRFGYHWDHLDDLILMQSDVEKRLNLQISRSSNDNNRRSMLKFKKEDAASVSDSKLLYTDSESKKHKVKCDKKSRGDSPRKERSCGSRKQVQWKTEVDVIYFSTHMAANGDRTGEVIGRVMEPLREEWEQQRKGFYAKVVPSHMDNHVKDHFISLLKI